MRFELALGLLDAAGLRDALDRAGVRQNAYADRLFDAGLVEIAEPPRRVRVAVIPLAELGAPEGDTLEGAIRRAAGRGLSPAPLEAAVLLRLAWPDQPPDLRVTVASSRPTPDELAPRGFYLRRDDEGAWLRGYVASDDWVFDASERLAFVRDGRSA